MMNNKIASDRYEEVAILNGMQQSTIVKKGMLVKMLEKKLKTKKTGLNFS